MANADYKGAVCSCRTQVCVKWNGVQVYNDNPRQSAVHRHPRHRRHRCHRLSSEE